MLTVILAVLNSLQLNSAKELFNSIILFIPNIIVSLIILLFGLYAAKFISSVLSSSLKNMKDEAAGLIEKIAYYAIVIFTVFLVLGQLKIAQSIITNAFILAFGGICLAFGLAFGLGGKESAAEVLKNIKSQQKEK
jgi:small-conductance mechanosensitive channel